MTRSIRFQYPGGCYHIMARGDGGKTIFESDDDCMVFIARLGQACGRCGWKVHAWVLMENHFHLLLETPEANLVEGMKWLLGTYSQGWNRMRQQRGHVFQGRYKSIPINAEETGAYYFRIVADYIHLNPARAGLAGGERGKLVDYRWSSLGFYAKGKGPEWLVIDRVLQAFELAENARGRQAYIFWLETRAREDGGKISQAAEAALQKGWYLGEEGFKDKLLGMIDRVRDGKNPRNVTGGAVRDHGEAEAKRLVRELGKVLKLPSKRSELMKSRKGDERKVLLAAVLRRRTSVRLQWISDKLVMGHPGSVSRLIGGISKNRELAKRLEELVKC